MAILLAWFSLPPTQLANYNYRYQLCGALVRTGIVVTVTRVRRSQMQQSQGFVLHKFIKGIPEINFRAYVVLYILSSWISITRLVSGLCFFLSVTLVVSGEDFSELFKNSGFGKPEPKWWSEFRFRPEFNRIFKLVVTFEIPYRKHGCIEKLQVYALKTFIESAQLRCVFISKLLIEGFNA